MAIFEESHVIGYGEDFFQLRDPLSIGGQRTGYSFIEGKAEYSINYQSWGLILSEKSSELEGIVRRESFLNGYIVEETVKVQDKQKVSGVVLDDSAFVPPASAFLEQGSIEFSPLYWVGGILGLGVESDFPMDAWNFRSSGYIESDTLSSYSRSSKLNGVVSSEDPKNIKVNFHVHTVGYFMHEKVEPFSYIKERLSGVIDLPLFSSGIEKIGGAGYIPDETQKFDVYYNYRIRGAIEADSLGEIGKEVVEFTSIVEIGKFALLLELPEDEEIIAFSGASLGEFVFPDKRRVGGIITFTEKKLFIIETSKDRVFKITVKPIYPWRGALINLRK